MDKIVIPVNKTHIIMGSYNRMIIDIVDSLYDSVVMSPYMSHSCPVSLAGIDAGLEKVHTYCDDMEFDYQGVHYSVLHTPRQRKIIEMYDMHEGMREFTYIAEEDNITTDEEDNV